MSDSLDTSAEQEYNQPQSPDNVSSTELSREELQNQLTEKYQQVLLSNNLEEISKVEEELQKFLGGGGVESSAKVDEPEVPPANTEANQSTTTPAEGSTGAKEGATSQQGASNPNEDWLSSLDPSVRKIVEDKLESERKAREYHEQRYRSEVGRQTAFQKKYEDERKAREQLERQLRDGAVSQPSNSTATPANAQTANAKKIQELTEKIAKVKGTDPELADLLELTRDALLETQQNISASVPKVDMSAVDEIKRELEAERERRQWAEGRAELDRLTNGFASVVFEEDPKTNKSIWDLFYADLPPYKQKMVQDNAYNPQVYADLLKSDYLSWAERYNAAHGYVQQTQPNQQPIQPEVDPRAAQVQQARQAKLTTSAAQPARSAPPPGHKPSLEERIKNPPPPGTPEFDSFLEEMDRAIAQGKLKL